MRKIIQIAIGKFEDTEQTMYALCDDGKIFWLSDIGKWIEMDTYFEDSTEQILLKVEQELRP